jgi:isoquinoline 1-oxidoreductase beta subunit
MRIGQAPRVHVRALDTSGEMRGTGEPMVRTAAPALAAAVFTANGTRLREMPFGRGLTAGSAAG